jgi:hypothetical protein
MLSRLTLGSTQPHIQQEPGAISLGVKRPEREADNSPPTNAEVKKTWVYTSTSPYVFCQVYASQAGEAYVIILPMSGLWSVNLMFVLNRSLLNREYILIKVLKALASIISMCNLHVTFLLKITPRYFTQQRYSNPPYYVTSAWTA